MNPDEDMSGWEDLCRRCGRCCYEKIEYEGEVYYTDIPCDKLDLSTCLCTVYPERTTARPGCVQLTPDIIRKGILPADCPYVKSVKNYHAPHLWDDDPENEEKVCYLLEHLEEPIPE